MDRRQEGCTSPRPRRRCAILLAIASMLCAATATAQDAKRAAFRQATADARRAMAERDLDAAKEHLKVATANAQTQEDRDELARLETLHDYVGQFWNLLGKEAAKLAGGEELVVGKTRVAFVEAAGGSIVVKVAGQLRRYTIKTIPTSLALALAEKSFANNAVSKIVIGAFLAMDAKGDRKQAKRLWDAASRAGLSQDVALLMPELGAAVGGKLPVPADAAIQAAEARMRQEYKHLYSLIGVPVRQKELVRKFLREAPSVAGDPARRYAMLREARDLSVAAGDAMMAEKAIEALDQYYQVDLLRMRLEVLEMLAPKARGLDAGRQIVLDGLEIAKHAAKAGRWDDAQKAAKLALLAARKTRSRGLMQQAAFAARQIEMLRKQGRPKR